MATKVTCKVCGMSWDTREEYMKDSVKCGNPRECKLLISEAKRKAMWPHKEKQQIEEPKGLIVNISTGTIPDPYADEEKILLYYQPVPKVIFTEMKWIK